MCRCFCCWGRRDGSFLDESSFLGLLAAFAGMVGEALWLHRLDVQTSRQYVLVPASGDGISVLPASCILTGARIDRSAACPCWYISFIPGVLSWFASGRTGRFRGGLCDKQCRTFLCCFGADDADRSSSKRLLWGPVPCSPPPVHGGRSTWMHLAHNAAVLQESLPPGQRLMAVVKADAYGHGATQVCRRPMERERSRLCCGLSRRGHCAPQRGHPRHDSHFGLYCTGGSTPSASLVAHTGSSRMLATVRR